MPAVLGNRYSLVDNTINREEADDGMLRSQLLFLSSR